MRNFAENDYQNLNRKLVIFNQTVNNISLNFEYILSLAILLLQGYSESCQIITSRARVVDLNRASRSVRKPL